jgi:MFS superfamily sulfate permease-like transporter
LQSSWHAREYFTAQHPTGLSLIESSGRKIKARLVSRYPAVVYFPDRFIVVFLSAILTWSLRWDQAGLEVLGDVRTKGHSLFAFQWPFVWGQLRHVRTAMSTSFIISLLGFFESSVAAKSLSSSSRDGIQGMTPSPNRDLVALGLANIVGGCFMALPAFGGYGRSKLAHATGARTPMACVFLAIITIICIVFLLPYFYYLPVSPVFFPQLSWPVPFFRGANQ